MMNSTSESIRLSLFRKKKRKKRSNMAAILCILTLAEKVADNEITIAADVNIVIVNGRVGMCYQATIVHGSNSRRCNGGGRQCLYYFKINITNICPPYIRLYIYRNVKSDVFLT